MQILDKEKARLLRSMNKEKEHDGKVESAMRAFDEAHGESQRLLEEQQALLDQGEVEMLHGIGLGEVEVEDGGRLNSGADHEESGATRKLAWSEQSQQAARRDPYLSDPHLEYITNADAYNLHRAVPGGSAGAAAAAGGSVDHSRGRGL